VSALTVGLRASGQDDAPSAAERPPALPPQPRGAGHEALRHQDDDGHEDRAEQEIPALDVAGHHVLDDDHQCGPDDRAKQGSGAAGDHHQQHLGRCGQRRGLRADELGVVDEQNPSDGGEQARQHAGPEADRPDMIAERVHAARLIAGALQRRPERRTHEDRHDDDGDQENNECRVVEPVRSAEIGTEWRRPGFHVDAVVAAGEADPAVGEPPDDLAERHRDHDEADAGGAQRQRGKHGRAARLMTSAPRIAVVWPSPIESR